MSRLATFAGVLALAAAVALTACYDNRFDAPDPSSGCETPNETIAALRRIYAGSPFVVSSPIVLSGVVTSCDNAGNFYRTFCVEEDQAALEVVAGIDQLHNDFPIGCQVVIRLNGLTVGENYGVIQVGRAPAPGSAYEVDFLGSRAALTKAVTRCGESLQQVEPARTSIPELSPQRTGTLVRIDNLRYAPEDLTSVSWAGYKRFTDADGNEIFTYVRSYADFADKEVPTGWLSLVGILQYDDAGDGRYLIKLRDEGDCLQ